MKRILVACFIIFLCSPSWATKHTHLSQNTYTRKAYVGAGVGDLFNRVQDNNYIATGPGWPDDYSSNQSADHQAYGFLTGGFMWVRTNNWLPSFSVGVRGMYAPYYTVSGYIEQYSVSQLTNYQYSYNVQLSTLLATFKADLYRWHNLMPYVLLGGGLANYSVKNYSESALKNVTPRVSPGFGNHAGNNFAYQAGAGFDYAMTKTLWLNLEFNYTDYGIIYSGTGSNYTSLTGENYSTQRLKNRITSTSLLLGLTYYM
jgi:opacity protein-like surface antigen